tara:strand:- start:5651 stop:5908 length:258 start_codon:yes stop_codon:yes gene_type:complete
MLDQNSELNVLEKFKGGKRMNYLLNALIDKLEGEVKMHKANIMVYMDNPTGIGDHPGVIQAIEMEAEKMAEAQEKIDIIKKNFCA